MTRIMRTRARAMLLRFYKSTEDHFCPYCHILLKKWDGKKKRHGNYTTVDHINPICRGGTDTDDNLILCCSSCNGHKGHLNWDEYWCVKGNHAELYREKQRVAYELGYITELYDNPEQAALGRFARRQAVLIAEGRIKDPDPDCPWCKGVGFTNKIKTKYCRCAVIGQKPNPYSQRGKRNRQPERRSA